MSLKLKYFQKFSNVGDAFSEKVAHKYLSKKLDKYENIILPSSNIIIIGSILEWVDQHTTICGAGLIRSSSTLNFKPKAVNCVRGPLTAFFLERQGIPAGKVFGDPGLLISKIYKPIKHLETTSKIGVIPHYVDKDSLWVEHCKKLGVTIINVLAPLSEFTQQLQQCDVILSSSLHGLVFAHSYGKPALWVEISNGVIGDGFKFYDYYLAAGISPEKVIRFKVSSDTDPNSLVSMAEAIAVGTLISDIEGALHQTKLQLLNN